MSLPNREDCIHACVCKYDDAMCPMDCGHFADYTPELEKARKYDEALPLIKEMEEKARKWDRVTRAYNSSPPCDCPEWDNEKAECMIETPHCPFNDVVAALEEAT